MNITLYSTGCPKCGVLKTKLDQKNITYTLCEDIDVMQAKGMMEAPALEVDGNLMNFVSAVKWVNEYDNSQASEDDNVKMHCENEVCSLY